ncbi:MAG TPA: hypothetical protein VGH79_12245 [Gaiellaceae bacterium]|jgi:Tol biopolymer transport system component
MTRVTRSVVAAGVAVLALPLPLALGSSAPTGKIAFVRDPLCKQGQAGHKTWNECGKGEIAVVSAGGGRIKILTHDSVTENDPVWSPDGKRIAFIRPKPHTSDQIWVMDANGTHQRALTKLGTKPQLFGADLEPALSWSPDGKSIVFSAFPTDQGGNEQLYRLGVRSRKVTQLTDAASGATNPVWSPDGKWIAFVGSVAPDRIYLLAPRTHRTHALKTRKGASVAGLGIAWSPDSKRLAYNAKGKVVAFDLTSRTFGTLAGQGDSPSWSEDGGWVVFDSGDHLKEVRADGSGLHSILRFDSRTMRYYAPSWG